MLISPAYAQAAAGDGGSPLITLLPIVLIFVVFYFLLIRPQQKKMKQHKGMVAAVRRGDRVVTAGGLIATVTKVVSDTELQIELADGVRVRVIRGTISEVLAKTEPSQDKSGGKAANDPGKAAQGQSGGLLSRLLGVDKKN